MTDKKTLLTRWNAVSKRVDIIKADLRQAELDLHKITRELHGVPIGTTWRLRIGKRMFGNVTEYDAVLQDIRPLSVSRPEDKPWATVFRLKKDGTPESSARQVYDYWEVIGPYEAPK